jgi:hypothetical protein
MAYFFLDSKGKNVFYCIKKRFKYPWSLALIVFCLDGNKVIILFLKIEKSHIPLVEFVKKLNFPELIRLSFFLNGKKVITLVITPRKGAVLRRHFLDCVLVGLWLDKGVTT